MDNTNTPGDRPEAPRSGYPSRDEGTQQSPTQSGDYNPPATGYTPPPPAGYAPPATGYNPLAAGYTPPPPAATTQLPGSYNNPQQYGTPGSPQPYVVQNNYPLAGGYTANALVSDPNIAAIIEIVPGLFGLLGIGHLVSGRIMSGVALLLGSLAFIALGWIVILPFLLLTCGLGICLLPLLWLIPFASGLWLRNDMMKRQMSAYRP